MQKYVVFIIFLPLLISIDKTDGHIFAVHVALGKKFDLELEGVFAMMKAELGRVEQHPVVGPVHEINEVVNNPSVSKR